MSFSDILLKSFSENLKQFTKITKLNHFSLLFVFFMKTEEFCTVFIADMNFAYKNTLISAFSLNLQVWHNFRKFYQRLPWDSADFLKKLKNCNFVLFAIFFHLKNIFYDFF